MDIKVVRYTEDKREVWNNFIRYSDNGTIFHDLDFLSYHPPERFNEHHLMFYNKDKLVGVMPMALFEENGRVIAKSPYGGSFGGIIVRPNISLNDSLELVGSLTKYFRKEGINEAFIIPTPIYYHNFYNAYIDFCLLKENWKLGKREIINIIPLEKIKDEIEVIFSKNAIRNLRKAVNSGMIVKETDDFGDFYKILRQTIEIKHTARITHSYSELMRIKEIKREEIKLFMGYYKNEAIAGVLSFICNRNCLLTFYNCFLMEFQWLRPLNLVFREVARFAHKKGFKYIDLGTSSVNMEPRMSLVRFKESIGGIGGFRDTYIWKDE